VVLQALDGRADFEQHLAEGGQRCTASAFSGIELYPFSSDAETEEWSLQVKGAFHTLVSSESSSGRKGAGLAEGA